MCNFICGCTSFRYCQLDAYGKLIDFNQVFTGVENFRDQCYCPPSIEDHYYDFMRPKIAANKFIRRTRSVDRFQEQPSTKETTKTLQGSTKKTGRVESDRVKAGYSEEHFNTLDTVNMSKEYAKIMDNPAKIKSTSFHNDQLKYNKSQSKKVDISNIETASKSNLNYCPENNSQCAIYPRQIKSGTNFMDKNNYCVPGENSETDNKCYCNWCKKPIDENTNSLKKSSSDNSQINKRTIGGSDNSQALYQKNSWIASNSTSKLYPNQANESNHFSRMEVITEDPEENLQNDDVPNYMENINGKSQNPAENVQKIHQQTVEGKYADIFILMHDNILKSVSKSMESLLIQYCNKTLDEVENLSKRVERNEYILEKVYNDLLLRIAEQGDMHLQRFQYLLHYFAQNQNFKQMENSNHNCNQNSSVYLNNHVNRSNMAKVNSSNLNVNSGHSSRRFSRNFGGGSLDRTAHSEQYYDRNVVKDTPNEVFQKSYKYTNTAPTQQKSNSALKQSRAETLPRQLEINKFYSNNKPQNIKNNQCSVKPNVNYKTKTVASYMDNPTYNYHNMKWISNTDKCCCDSSQNLEQDNRNIAKLENNHEQLYYQRKQQQELQSQKRFLQDEYTNKMFVNKHLDKSNVANNSFRMSRKKSGQSSMEWQQQPNKGSNSEFGRFYNQHFSGDIFNKNMYLNDKHSESNAPTKLNTRFVYPTPQRVAYNFED